MTRAPFLLLAPDHLERVRAAAASGEETIIRATNGDRIRPVAADHAFQALRGHVVRHAILPERHRHIPARAAGDVPAIREVEEDEIVGPTAEEGVGAGVAEDEVVPTATVYKIVTETCAYRAGARATLNRVVSTTSADDHSLICESEI